MGAGEDGIFGVGVRTDPGRIREGSSALIQRMTATRSRKTSLSIHTCTVARQHTHQSFIFAKPHRATWSPRTCRASIVCGPVPRD